MRKNKNQYPKDDHFIILCEGHNKMKRKKDENRQLLENKSRNIGQYYLHLTPAKNTIRLQCLKIHV